MKIYWVLCFAVASLSASAGSSLAQFPKVEVRQDGQADKVGIAIDGKEVVAYQHSSKDALPHFWPLKSPSGKLLTVQHPDHHPHHRSIWIADKIQGEGLPAIDFYHSWKNYLDKEHPEKGYRHFIRHDRFGEVKRDENRAVIEAHLKWIANQSQEVLDDHRTLRLVALGEGEYLIDLGWELKPSANKVTFVSDWIHYGWPYVCIHSQFSGRKGGTITNDSGGTGEEGTHQKFARWVDYSNTVDGVTEGLTVMVPGDEPVRWLTRNYGTFGPRRPEAQSGKQFTLNPGDSLKGRAAILVHRGGVKEGRVAERYQQYVDGEL